MHSLVPKYEKKNFFTNFTGPSKSLRNSFFLILNFLLIKKKTVVTYKTFREKTKEVLSLNRVVERTGRTARTEEKKNFCNF